MTKHYVATWLIAGLLCVGAMWAQETIWQADPWLTLVVAPVAMIVLVKVILGAGNSGRGAYADRHCG